MPDHNRTTDRAHCIPGLNGRCSSSRTNPPQTGVSPVNDRHHRLPRPGVTPHNVPHQEEAVIQFINMRLLKLLLSRQHPGDKVLINTQILGDAARRRTRAMHAPIIHAPHLHHPLRIHRHHHACQNLPPMTGTSLINLYRLKYRLRVDLVTRPAHGVQNFTCGHRRPALWILDR